MKFSTAMTNVLGALSKKQRVQLKEEVAYITHLISDKQGTQIAGTGRHWQHKRETEKAYLLTERGGDSDLYTYNELLNITHLKPQYLAVRLSQGAGEFCYKRGDQIFTITRVRK